MGIWVSRGEQMANQMENKWKPLYKGTVQRVLHEGGDDM